MSAAARDAVRVRWTPSTIQKAMLCPKPKGALQRFQESVAARGEPVGRLLSHILAHADIIDDGRRLDHDGVMFTHSGAWLLVPLPADLLDQLLAIGVEQVDLELDPDIEPDHDGEPSLGANEAVSQVYSWALPPDCLSPDLEDDQIDEGGEDDEPSAINTITDQPPTYVHPELGRFIRL